MIRLPKTKWLLCACVFTCACYWLSAQLITRHYHDYLTHQLSPKIHQAWLDAADMGKSPQTQTWLALQAVKQFNRIEWQNALSFFSACQASAHSVQNARSGSLSAGLDLHINLNVPSLPDQTIQIACAFKPISGLSFMALFIAVICLVHRLLPDVQSSQDQALVRYLQSLTQQNLVDKAQLKRWLKQLNTFRHQHPCANIRLPYLKRFFSQHILTQANQISTVDFAKLLTQSSQPLVLEFFHRDHHLQARISSIDIPLSVTPTLYWYWYATFRTQDKQGWVMNPPTNRPDHEMAQSLLALMTQFTSHGRAKKELEDNGVRAKTLDQNRNKIKEALINALGEELAQECGFESHKQDGKQQTRYRLKMSPKQIFYSIKDD